MIAKVKTGQRFAFERGEEDDEGGWCERDAGVWQIRLDARQPDSAFLCGKGFAGDGEGSRGAFGDR